MTVKKNRILLLGDAGKMGRALLSAFPAGSEVICHNSRTFDADNFLQVRKIIEDCRPELLFNTVAFLGIDPCEREPEKAFRLNTLFPGLLAECSLKYGYTLVHFSTDAVFNDSKREAYTESDPPNPLNIYGISKFGGDCLIQSLAQTYYIFRVSILFGLTDRQNQFVDRMLMKARSGEKVLRIADDIVLSPTFASDAAEMALTLIGRETPFGLYHLVNSGRASLYDLMSLIVEKLGLDVRIERASHREFSAVGRKNTRTPLRSEKIAPMRKWEEAIDEYCGLIAGKWRH